MTHRLQTFRSYAAIILFAALIGAPLHAQAGDINPQIANCQEITGPATQTQVEFCTGHVGCNLLMGLQKACTKVKTFLNNLKNLTSGKSSIDGSDVFDAAAPSAEGDASFNAISRSIKSSYDKQPKKEIVSGKFENGVNWVYEGGMKNGVRNGTGVLITDTGTTFRGEFVEGRQAGLGELFNDKSRKAGVMANAKMDGAGVERYADGRRYEGEYKGDKQDGKGVMAWKNGARHEGGYKDGLASGQGTYKYADGREYSGDFSNDKFNGQGTFKFPNGDQYTGNFVDNKFNGQGTYTRVDGVRFEGEWRDNKTFNGTETNAKGSKTTISNGAVVESAEQAVARVTKDYDQRINAARQECASSRDSCENSCTTSSATASLLMILSKNMDGIGAATEQTAQCNERCDQTKSSCDRQVNSLEREKKQATAAAEAEARAKQQQAQDKLTQQVAGGGSAGPSPKAGATSHASQGQSSVGRCGFNPALLQAYFEAIRHWRSQGAGIGPMPTYEGVLQKFEEGWKFWNIRSKSEIAARRAESARFEEAQRLRPSLQGPHIVAEERVYLDRAECESGLSVPSDGRQQSSLAVTPTAGGAVGCAATPQESFRRFDNEMSTFGQRFPNQPDRGGARDQYQYSLFYATNGLQALERYRNCLSDADYQANKSALEGMRNSGQIGCDQLSSSQGTCTPTYPSNWGKQ